MHESSSLNFGGAEFTRFQSCHYAEGGGDTWLTAVSVTEGEYELAYDDGLAYYDCAVNITWRWRRDMGESGTREEYIKQLGGKCEYAGE